MKLKSSWNQYRVFLVNSQIIFLGGHLFISQVYACACGRWNSEQRTRLIHVIDSLEHTWLIKVTEHFY